MCGLESEVCRGYRDTILHLGYGDFRCFTLKILVLTVFGFDFKLYIVVEDFR